MIGKTAPHHRINRSTRDALSALDSEVIKALLMLSLLKPCGLKIVGCWPDIAALCGQTGKVCQRSLHILVQLGLISLQPGVPRGQGRGWSPMTITVLRWPDGPEFATDDLEGATSEQRLSNASATAEEGESKGASILESKNIRIQEVGRETPTPPPGLGYSQSACLGLLVSEFNVQLNRTADTLAGWADVVDGLDREDIREITALRQPGQALTWPSDFRKLRTVWDSDLIAREAANEERRQAKAAKALRAADDAAKAAAKAIHAEHTREAHARANLARETTLGRRWQDLLAGTVKSLPSAMRNAQTYPLNLTAGRLLLHVPTVLVEHQVRRDGTTILTHCRDAFAPEPVDFLDLVINGHAHPTVAALPVIAVSTLKIKDAE